ncbi:hypothetical protein [Clostridium gasigenes]|uniref:Uncharacterized protein n=1 Tax=Clostridium gasigenes TaxID=94869 RepID=A0A7X0SAB4_9CLOT|nr:hypothetical protein [Clostridium gasigenes]MBB6713930.1 hypothetical protein [Clostridium gasigenes]
MKGKGVNTVIFILSIICLIISIKLFWNMGIFVDEHNTSPDIISGGDFWLYMDWLRLGFTAVICVLSGISLFRDNK